MIFKSSRAFIPVPENFRFGFIGTEPFFHILASNPVVFGPSSCGDVLKLGCILFRCSLTELNPADHY
jgi:hypothetical protein